MPSRIHTPHSLATIRAAKRPTDPLLYFDSSLCHVVLILTVPGV
ncbi:BgTH12-05838 [Blumeria graminis f. sp. triticale]|uniref:Bgt-51321 n=2 Tax=Blumeria graminis TaxID=34373 RepID=A0A9X9QED6_BLUGR|nr:BgTH12-05838 [Blumeria graminis f. sp. triticale]VDB90845.1 Bgt-51321 [Blumeria graminis f. sp. tritici]